MCVYNRPFDDQRHYRIHAETQIFIMLMSMIAEGNFELVDSFALRYENSKNPKVENRLMISDLLGYSSGFVACDSEIVDRSIGLEKLGLMGMDAVHVACAEKAKTNFFITCDNSLLNKLKRIDTIQVRCYNLLDFLSKEVFKDENIK